MTRVADRTGRTGTWLGRLLRAIPHDARWVGLLVLVNGAGAIYGFRWYVAQLAATPLRLWPIVPDSPLSALLFAVYLAFRLFGRRTPWLGPLAQLATFKYGLWTVIVLGGYMLRTLQPQGELLLLIATHGAMALEAYLFMRADPARAPPLAAVFAWLTFNDAYDYLGGTHPRLPDPAAVDFVAIEAAALTWLALAVALYTRRQVDPVRYT